MNDLHSTLIVFCTIAAVALAPMLVATVVQACKPKSIIDLGVEACQTTESINVQDAVDGVEDFA